MKLSDIANSDNIIKAVSYCGNSLCLEILSWNEKIIKIEFDNCYGLKVKMAINAEIGDITTNNLSSFSAEIRDDILSGDGDEREWSKLQDTIFFDSWSDRVLLEIVAEHINISLV